MTIISAFSSLLKANTKATKEQLGGKDVLIPHVVISGESVLPLPEGASTGNAQGTRAYNLAQASRTAVAAASSGAVGIGMLGASREVMLVTSVRCHIRFGDNNVTAAAAAAGVLPLPADAMFHMIVPEGVTHYRVIRDNADGFLSVIPVL